MEKASDVKNKVKLTERTFLGHGYHHWFKNDATEEIVVVETTKKQYESMGGVDGAKNNPVLPGHTWIYSAGGTIKVDTPSGFLGVNEYTRLGSEVAMYTEDKKGDPVFKTLPPQAVDQTGNVDKDLWL